MAKVNLVDKKIQLGLGEIVKYQLLSYCYFNKIVLSNFDIDCLTVLALHKEAPELSKFCSYMAEIRHNIKMKTWNSEKTKKLSESPDPSIQSVRNILLRAEKYGLIIKGKKHPRKVKINDSLNIQTTGNILLNYKVIYVDTKEA